MLSVYLKCKIWCGNKKVLIVQSYTSGGKIVIGCKKKFENLEFPCKNLFLQLQFSQLYRVSQKRFMERQVFMSVSRDTCFTDNY